MGSRWCEVGGSRSGPGRAYLDAVADSARPPVIEKYARVLAAADVYTDPRTHNAVSTASGAGTRSRAGSCAWLSGRAEPLVSRRRRGRQS